MGDQLPDTRVPDTQEFFENQSQTNALNAKRTFDEYQDISLTAARRSQVNFDNLQQVSLRALNASVELQQNLNQKILADIEATKIELETLRSQRARFADDANYVTRYDLSNPVTTATGDTVRAGAVPANRITDTVGAVSGGAVDVAAAGVSTANLAVLEQLVAQLTQATQTIAALASTLVTAAGGASTPSQTQPKPAAA